MTKIKSIYPNLVDFITLYLLELKYLLTYYIHLQRNSFDEIESNYTYFENRWPTHQPNIVEITVYYKIVKKELLGKNEAYNNKRRTI